MLEAPCQKMKTTVMLFRKEPPLGNVSGQKRNARKIPKAGIPKMRAYLSCSLNMGLFYPKIIAFYEMYSNLSLKVMNDPLKR